MFWGLLFGLSMNVDGIYRAVKRGEWLQRAAWDGNLIRVMSLLAEGANPNHLCNTTKKTCLHYAAAQDHGEVAEALLSCGADVNARDKDGWTPLDYCGAFPPKPGAMVSAETVIRRYGGKKGSELPPPVPKNL